jgi:hypothetical protein
MKRTLLVAAAGLAFATPALADSWICLYDGAAGFRWSATTQSFEPQVFTNSETMIIRPFKAESDIELRNASGLLPTYVVVRLGEETPMSFFYGDMPGGNSTHVGAWGAYFFPATLELVIMSVWHPMAERKTDRTDKTVPYMAIAKCSSI